jgi:hypothetical protein
MIGHPSEIIPVSCTYMCLEAPELAERYFDDSDGVIKEARIVRALSMCNDSM